MPGPSTAIGPAGAPGEAPLLAEAPGVPASAIQGGAEYCPLNAPLFQSVPARTPAQGRADLGGEKLQRAKGVVDAGADVAELTDQLGGAAEGRVGGEAGYHVVDRTHVEHARVQVVLDREPGAVAGPDVGLLDQEPDLVGQLMPGGVDVPARIDRPGERHPARPGVRPGLEERLGRRSLLLRRKPRDVR